MARHVCVATTNQSSRFPLTKSTCCFFFIATKSLFGSFSVTSFNFSFLYIHTDTHTHTVCPIIITELSSQSKAPLSLLWLWPPLSPPLFLPLALSFYQAGGESLRGRWGKEPPPPPLCPCLTACCSNDCVWFLGTRHSWHFNWIFYFCTWGGLWGTGTGWVSVSRCVCVKYSAWNVWGGSDGWVSVCFYCTPWPCCPLCC